MAKPEEKIVAQMNDVLSRFIDPEAWIGMDDLRQIPAEAVEAYIVSCTQVIERLAPPRSPYVLRADAVRANPVRKRVLAELAGIVQALRDDYRAGLLVELRSLIHADLFDDFLDMAQHLLDSQYKDPAAVLAGAVLEEHLRKLADRHGVAARTPDDQPRKADTLNADLVKASAYNKSQQKDVTAWLGRRNDAAHGHFERYDTAQVAVMLEGIRGFVNRYPA